jgi:hypothetical protein
MSRDLPPYRFELRYPSDGLDEGEENGPEESALRRIPMRFCAPKRPKRPGSRRPTFGRPVTPPTRSAMLSGEAIGGASIHIGSTTRRRQTDIGRR